jgi:hypothetical protein
LNGNSIRDKEIIEKYRIACLAKLENTQPSSQPMVFSNGNNKDKKLADDDNPRYPKRDIKEPDILTYVEKGNPTTKSSNPKIKKRMFCYQPFFYISLFPRTTQ